MKPIVAVPATLALVYRAWSRKSLTPLGIVVAALTAVVHAIHPSPALFTLLTVFFLGATYATKVKHDVKSRLTISASGSAGGEGPRTHVQVLANSVVASILILLHVRQLYGSVRKGPVCFLYGGDILLVGIVANYAAVAADTFSSELGILSKSQPRLITSPTLRKVPPGTNGGITVTGIAAGALGAFTIALASLMLPFCPVSPVPSLARTGLEGGLAWGWREKGLWVLAVTLWGTLGSIVDSILGGLLQASVLDKHTGKIVEGSGGRKVLIRPTSVQSTGLGEVPVRKGSGLRAAEQVTNAVKSRAPGNSRDFPGDTRGVQHESRKVECGYDILDNNAVNLLMATIMSIGGMAVASYIWDVPLSSVLY